MLKPSEEQRQILEDLQQWFYSGRLPHVAVVQKCPGKAEEVIGFDTLLAEYLHDRLTPTSEEKVIEDIEGCEAL